MATIELGDATLFYEDLGGAGPACLMLHGGLGMDHSYFRPAFDRLHPRLRLVYFDMRGNGRSSRPPAASMDMDVWADDVAALADRLEIDRFLAIGHSYGGFVAQELALRHPQRLLGLVLVGTTPGNLGATEPSDSPQGDPPSSAQLEIMGSPVGSDEEMSAMLDRLLPYYLHRVDPAVLRDLLSDTIHAHVTMIRSSEVLGTWSSYDRLPSVTCPVLVVGARHDSFCSAAQSERIARQIPGATLKIIERSGHFPWVEEPDETWSTLDAWIDEHVLEAAQRS